MGDAKQVLGDGVAHVVSQRKQEGYRKCRRICSCTFPSLPGAPGPRGNHRHVAIRDIIQDSQLDCTNGTVKKDMKRECVGENVLDGKNLRKTVQANAIHRTELILDQKVSFKEWVRGQRAISGHCSCL